MKVINSVLSFLMIVLSVQAKSIHLKQNTILDKNIWESYTTFIVDDRLDLQGALIRLPFKSTLSFTANGSIHNGRIVGNYSLIKAGSRLIFDNVTIEGNWRNTKVYSKWFYLDNGHKSNNYIFAQLMQLCSGKQLTHFYMQKGTYCVSAIHRSAPILVPSNVYWHNEATIKMLPTDLEWYNIVLLNKSNNVTIDGGMFIGDVEKHKGQTGEWGHGIKCGGATNVVIKNLICSHCWGDGIDLIEGIDKQQKPSINCNNVTVEHVKCLNNRRQGISIEAASNVKLINCEFAYTGFPKFTSPGAGLDIEPWTDNRDKVWNVTVMGCKLHDNKGYDIQCEPNIKKSKSYTQLHNNISLLRNEIGTMRIQYTKGIFVRDCSITKDLFVQWTDGIELRKSKIENFKKREKVTNIKMKNCNIKSKSNDLYCTVSLVGLTVFALVGGMKYKKVI